MQQFLSAYNTDYVECFGNCELFNVYVVAFIKVFVLVSCSFWNKHYEHFSIVA